jgi:hypothetical protein
MLEIHDILSWRFQTNGLPMLQEDHNNTHPWVALIASGLSTGLALVILGGLATCLLLNRHHVAVRTKLHTDLVPLRQQGSLSSFDTLIGYQDAV